MPAEKRDHENQTSEQEEHTAKHGPEMADAGNAKPYGRNDEQYPSKEVDLVICHLDASNSNFNVSINSVVFIARDNGAPWPAHCAA